MILNGAFLKLWNQNLKNTSFWRIFFKLNENRLKGFFWFLV